MSTCSENFLYMEPERGGIRVSVKIGGSPSSKRALSPSLQAETEQVAKTSCAEFSLIAHTRTSPYIPQIDPTPSSADPSHSDQLITVPLVVKGDVAGSVEALVGILSSRQPQGVQLRVVQSGVGPISDSDMDMAISTKGITWGRSFPCT